MVANFFGNAWSAGIGLLFVPIYLNYIGAEGYGLIGLFASLQVVLSLLDSGLSTTLNKELARLNALENAGRQMRNLVRTLGNVYWIIALTAGVTAFCISPLLAKYWVHPKVLSIETVTYSFMLLSISLIFQFPSGFYSGGLLGLQRQVMLNVLKILFATFKSIGALIVLFISRSVLAFFAWNLVVSAMQAIVMRYFVWYYLPKDVSPPVFDKQELKAVWRFAAGMLGISLTAILLTQADKIILSKILTLEQFGYYTVACTLGLMIYQVVAPLTQSYFPKFSHLLSLNKKPALKKMYHQGCQMISVLVLPATLILIFYSRELIFIWTQNGVTAEHTWLVTAIYAYGTGMNGLMNIPYVLTLSYGWTKLAMHLNIIFLIIMIPLTIFLAMRYGALGGALSWAIINTLYFFITPFLVHRKLMKGATLKWYWQDTLKPLAACLLIIAGVHFFLPLQGFGKYEQLVIILLTAIMAVTGSLFLADDLRRNILALLNRKNRNEIF